MILLIVHQVATIMGHNVPSTLNVLNIRQLLVQIIKHVNGMLLNRPVFKQLVHTSLAQIAYKYNNWAQTLTCILHAFINHVNVWMLQVLNNFSMPKRATQTPMLDIIGTELLKV